MTDEKDIHQSIFVWEDSKKEQCDTCDKITDDFVNLGDGVIECVECNND